MSQTNPGNRVSGIRNNARGMISWKALNSPMIPRAKPDMTSHFGSSFMIAAGTAKPAISKPIGTENPTPPIAKARQYNARNQSPIDRDSRLRARLCRSLQLKRFRQAV